MSAHTDAGRREIMDLLSQVPGFERSNEAQLTTLANELQVEDIAGRTFIVEGDRPQAVYFMLEGQVEVVRSTNGDSDKVLVGMLEPPSILGFAGVLADTQRVASVRARGKVRVLRMAAPTARALLLRDDDVSAVLRRGLLIALAAQLSQANQLFSQLSTTVEARREGLHSLVV